MLDDCVDIVSILLRILDTVYETVIRRGETSFSFDKNDEKSYEDPDLTALQ